ncbi:N-acetyltransferase [Striga asiatica]|uniref:histone acetyltransferase n=1 Tax=Striga asiatica TaxID=4170 RepID=A0A5A7QPG8_STRAF|nr:N-acetyltransferase [Striga asiatica]
MVNLKAPRRPNITYRPIRPSDYIVLEKIHGDLFPIRYESDFFHNVVNGRDIISWGAVDQSRPNDQSDELIGFVTARIVPARETSSLIQEVIKYSSSISTCRAVYLHVISYNNPAIHLYKKMSFECLRRLYNFYIINGQHYDSYLFVYYVNGGRSPCSLLELVTLLVTYAKGGIKSMAAKLWKNDEKRISRWTKCKESGYLLPTVQNKRTVTVESSRCQFI